MSWRCRLGPLESAAEINHTYDEEALCPLRDFPVPMRFAGSILKNQGLIGHSPVSCDSRDCASQGDQEIAVAFWDK